MTKALSCNRKITKKHRQTLSITIDSKVLDALKKWMKREGETNISVVVEGFIDCGVRDDCEGCEYYKDLPDEEKAKVKGKTGVGKWTNE